MGKIAKFVVASAATAIGAALVASSIYARKVNEEETNKLHNKAEANEALGRPFEEPSKMLDGLVKRGYRIEHNPTVVEVVYTEADSTLGVRLRISDQIDIKTLNDDPNIYENERVVEINGLSVTLKGDEGVSNISFVKDGFAYTLVSDFSMSDDAAEFIISSIE